MNHLNTYASCLAAVLVSIAMISATVAASNEDPKLVLNQEVDESFSFELIELADPDLAWVMEIVPEEWLENTDLGPETVVTVDLDGRVHANAICKESGDLIWVRVHMAWHGSIGVSVEGMPEMRLDLKNAQLMVEGYLPADDAEAIDLKVNFHVNGVLTGDEMVETDISTHLILQMQDGEITHLKLSMPELFCLAESD